jgi:hypothetical protein
VPLCLAQNWLFLVVRTGRTVLRMGQTPCPFAFYILAALFHPAVPNELQVNATDLLMFTLFEVLQRLQYDCWLK